MSITAVGPPSTVTAQSCRDSSLFVIATLAERSVTADTFKS